jgi:hypothetical protein
MNEAQIAQSVEAVRAFEEHLAGHGRALETATAQEVRAYLDAVIEAGLNSYDRLLALARYFRLAGLDEAFVYLVGIIGGQPILPSIARRTEELAGSEVRAAVFGGLEAPPLGAGQQAYPPVTNSMLRRLQSQVSVETGRRILAGNHHQIPPAAFEPLRALYLSEGIDAVLTRRRESLLAELEEHARTGKPWYEQLITPEVVAFVRANPEIQAGVHCGNRILVAKIPYSPAEYLSTDDPIRKRYFQCHCTLARAGILEAGQGVDPAFCYCSGGYEKLPFDVIFGQETEVELLESALGGSTRCRFAITIPASEASVRGK